MKKISVIMAAYNAQKYVRETLQSLKEQNMNDYELIVVDDGSTDQTAEILDHYALGMENVRVIHQQNAGVAAARNKAMGYATGEYIYFLDADDLLPEDSLQSLYEAANEKEADVVIGRYDTFDQYRSHNIHTVDQLVKKDSIDIYDKAILETFTLWNKLFRRKIVEENAITFPDGISYSEDAVFVMNCIYHSSRITGLDQVVLHYRKMNDLSLESGSATGSISHKKVTDILKAHDRIVEMAQNMLGEKGISEEERKSYLDAIQFKEVRTLISQFYLMYWRVEEELLKEITAIIREKIAGLSAYSFAQLVDQNFDVPVFDLPDDNGKPMDRAAVTIVLYGKEKNENFLRTLNSIYMQNMILIDVIVPEHMRDYLSEKQMIRGNLRFISEKGEKRFQIEALRATKTEYVTFIDDSIVYVYNAYKQIYRTLLKTQIDFLIETIYLHDVKENKILPLGDNQLVYETQKSLSCDTQEMEREYILFNKVFRTEFLKKMMGNKLQSPADSLPAIFKKGYYQYKNHGILIYQKEDEQFKEEISRMSMTIGKKNLQKNICLVKDKLCKNSTYLALMSTRMRKMNSDLVEIKNLIVEEASDYHGRYYVENVVEREEDKLSKLPRVTYPRPHVEHVVCADINIVGRLRKIQADEKQILLTVPYNQYFKMIMAYHEEAKEYGKLNNVSHIVVTAPYIRKIIDKYYNIGDARIIDGVPSMFMYNLCNIEKQEKARRRMEVYYPNLAGKKVLSIFLAGEFEDPTENPFRSFDMEKLMESLGEDWFIFTNSPYLLDLTRTMAGDVTCNIAFVKNASPNYEHLYYTDILVTNDGMMASSFAILRKPIYAMNYKDNFFEKYMKSYWPDLYMEESEELYDILRLNLELDEKQKEFCEEMAYGPKNNPYEVLKELLMK